MDQLELRVPFTGDAGKALNHIAETLSTNGFKIIKRSAYDLELTAPTNPQHLPQATRFLGPSRIHAVQTGNSLQLKADMAEAKALSKKAIYMTAAILCGTVVLIGAYILALPGSEGFAVPLLFIMVGLFACVGLWIRRLMSRVMPGLEQQFSASYGTLLSNAVMLAKT